jgi:hypothetical protein
VDPLAALLIVLLVLGGALAVIGTVNRSSAYEEIGKRTLLEEQGPSGKAKERELEAQELIALIEARNERRIRRGEPPLDVEAELQRLLDLEDPDRL